MVVMARSLARDTRIARARPADQSGGRWQHARDGPSAGCSSALGAGQSRPRSWYIEPRIADRPIPVPGEAQVDDGVIVGGTGEQRPGGSLAYETSAILPSSFPVTAWKLAQAYRSRRYWKPQAGVVY
jgi:hypothetical protein